MDCNGLNVCFDSVPLDCRSLLSAFVAMVNLYLRIDAADSDADRMAHCSLVGVLVSMQMYSESSMQ